jgi:hypothetical protein
MRRLDVLLALAEACGKGTSDKKPAPGSAGSAGSAAAPVAEGVGVFVDGQQVGSVTNAQAAAWPRVDTLVPTTARRLGKWQTVILTGDGQTQIESPSQKYPELVPALFPGKDGVVAFGYFDPVELAKKGNPQVRTDHLKEIRIVLAQNSGRGENESGEGGGTDPAKLELTIKTAKGEQKLLGAQLLEMPRQPPPGDNGGMGWPLAAILDKAGVKGAEKIIVSNATTNLTLEKQDLDPAASVPFVKLNRQGSLRFIVFKKSGDAWNRGGDLRELSRIEIVK